jgi:hypothetical protein
MLQGIVITVGIGVILMIMLWWYFEEQDRKHARQCGLTFDAHVNRLRDKRFAFEESLLNIFPHECEEPDCKTTVQYNDEPFCPIHERLVTPPYSAQAVVRTSV